ncbi:MAG TPA: histidine kinase dimerization/phosphoacceptor domain -containing protein [Spirochaetales bacterium]|nr:histidine kinase dimerization/phosphoacceptor domain -containing protein [Spirochaetales bacterium]HRY55228.1 histidine kinase dimerization/phosphoacceptor domain -containing protein [Spirochaetia bacterium]HRZ63525.1 histidine kinase dimerization/phosphoacceptor domain -containing protein [Spirochaetia bacterium]
MRRRPASLSAFFLLAVSLAAAVPALLIGAAGFAAIVGLSSSGSEALEEVFIGSISGEISALMDKAQSGLLLAGSSLGPGAEGERAIERLRELFPAFDMVLLLSERGRIELASPLGPEYLGMDMSRQGYFSRASGSELPVWSQNFISIYSGNPTITLTARVPDGYLVGYISLRSLSAAIERAGLPEGAEGLVVDSEGVVVAHRDYRLAEESYVVSREDLERGASARPGSPRRIRFAGEAAYARFVPFGSMGWYVGILRSPSAFLSERRAFLAVLAASLAGALAFGGAMAASGSSRLVGGLSSLALAARRVAEGEEAFVPGAGPGRSPFLEVGEALAAFGAMDLRVRERENAMRGAERELSASLEEKELLLREIHHRVKNNLQVISSILRLQAQAVEDQTVQDLFNECQNRVQAMALVHEQLYRSVSISAIRFGGYVESLAAVVWETFDGTGKGARLELDVADAEMSTDRAVPCGLVLVELLTNALKYAHPEGGGRISVAYREEGGYGSLSVSDDGVGLPEHFDPESARSLGLSLVTSLASQLRGRLELSGPPGAAFELRFPLA